MSNSNNSPFDALFHTYTCTHEYTQTHTGMPPLSLNVLWPVPAGDLTLTVLFVRENRQFSQMAAEWNGSEQQAELICSFNHCLLCLTMEGAGEGGAITLAALKDGLVCFLGEVHKNGAKTHWIHHCLIWAGKQKKNGHGTHKGGGGHACALYLCEFSSEKLQKHTY